MDKKLMEILACPVCKSALDLKIEREERQDIVSGLLLCPNCKVSYPIEDSIPNLLPPESARA